jgi:hypothetical protein
MSGEIHSRLERAFRQIVQVTDGTVEGFSEDAAKMARALLRAKVSSESTGKLEGSIHVVKRGEMQYAIVMDAENTKGRGYGASVDWGHRARNGRKIKGKKSIIRATFGMIKRWSRGERWRD